MKKISLIIFTVLLVWGFSSISYAYEASVIDTTNDVVVRAFTSDNGNSTYTVYIEVRELPDCGLVDGDITTVKNNSVVINREDDGTYKIKLDATDEYFSIFYDEIGRITYILIADSNGLSINKIEITVSRTINGECGSAAGGYYYELPGGNLCNKGMPSETQIVNNIWTWICQGSGGGTDANCMAYRKVDGLCGPANGGLYSQAPSTGLCSAGTPSAVSGSGPWTWNCNGANGGNNASCSANLAPSTGADLVVTGLTAPTSINNNSPFSFTVTVRNQGTGNAGAFVVKIYANLSPLPGGTLVYTWSIPGLNTGETLSTTLQATLSGLVVHGKYYLIAYADANGTISETDETNNIRYRYFTVGN